MNLPDVDFMVRMEQLRDLRAEAAQHRMLKEAKFGNREKLNNQFPALLHLTVALTMPMAKLLATIGKGISAFSCWLQNRLEFMASGSLELEPTPCN